MKKIICLLLIFSLSFLCLLVEKESLISVVAESCDYLVVDMNAGNTTLQINVTDCEMVIDRLQLEVVNVYWVEGRKIIEGYSSVIGGDEVINNRKINIQICLTDDLCLIGTPLIKNSF